jgi:choline transport protein
MRTVEVFKVWTDNRSKDLSYALALLSRVLGYMTGHATALTGPYSLPVPISISLNVTGLIFLLFASITFNFPMSYPVTPDSMNYTSAAIGVIGFISVVTWFTTGKRQFTGPSAVSELREDLAPMEEPHLTKDVKGV